MQKTEYLCKTCAEWVKEKDFDFKAGICKECMILRQVRSGETERPQNDKLPIYA